MMPCNQRLTATENRLLPRRVPRNDVHNLAATMYTMWPRLYQAMAAYYSAAPLPK
jgi:hypothetical protein